MKILHLLLSGSLVTTVTLIGFWNPIRTRADQLYFEWKYTPSAEDEARARQELRANYNPRARLEGWENFKFGMSRARFLVAGGDDHHSGQTDDEIFYPVRIAGQDFRAKGFLPYGYLKTLTLERSAVNDIESKDDCFNLARRASHDLDKRYGKHSTAEEGPTILKFQYKFEDGNSITVRSEEYGFCHFTITYDSLDSAAPQRGY